MNTQNGRPSSVDIGKVLTSQGIKGEVKIDPLTDFPERFQNMDQSRVRLPNGQYQTLGIQSVRFHKGFVLIKFEGIDDIDEALKLKDGILEVDLDEVHPLPPGHFYVFDLIGLKVEEEDGVVLGKLTDVTPNAANDIYTVKLQDGRSALLPAIKEVVRSIDLDQGKIVVRLLPGLLD